MREHKRIAMEADGYGLSENQVARLLGVTAGAIFHTERYAIRRLWQQHRKLRVRYVRMWGGDRRGVSLE